MRKILLTLSSRSDKTFLPVTLGTNFRIVRSLQSAVCNIKVVKSEWDFDARTKTESAFMAPIDFSIDAQKRIITWRSEGRVSQSEVEKMRQEVHAQANFNEGWNALLDLRAQVSTLSPEYIRQFAEHLPTFQHPVKWAIVTWSTVGQGMSNMFSILIEEKNIWARLFDRIEDAEAWLTDDTDGFSER